MSKHPMQKIVKDIYGIPRFVENKIVSKLLDVAREVGVDMNNIASWDVDREDRQQFAQLIGYSVSGFSSLNYADDDTVDAAYLIVTNGEEETEENARLKVLEELVSDVRRDLAPAVQALYGFDPLDR